MGFASPELIYRLVPWKTKEALELATLQWMTWFNHHRLLSSIGYIPQVSINELDLGLKVNFSGTTNYDICRPHSNNEYPKNQVLTTPD